MRYTGLLAVLASVAVLAQPAGATTTDFTGFAPGTVNGQGGWTVEDQWGNTSWGDDPAQYDQEVMDDGSGNMVWRASNAVTSGGLSAQPFSPVAPQVAGETGAALWNDRGPDHTSPQTPPNPGAFATTKTFYGAFDFRSATGGPQPDLDLSVSPSAKQFDGRMTYVELYDTGSGIDVYFYETGHTGDVWGASSQFLLVAPGLSYTDVHHVEICLEFVDGLADVGGLLYGNDIVQIFVDGALVHTGSSWETYYYGTPTFGLTSDDKRAVDSLTFAMRGTAVTSTLGGGYFFDNVIVDNQPCGGPPIPEPVTLAGLVLGVGSLVGYVRRRR